MKLLTLFGVFVIFLAQNSVAKVLHQDVRSNDGDWPCPVAADISPCNCTSDDDYNLAMDCSEAKSDAEISNAFTAMFPFDAFVNLLINQTDCNDCHLTTLAMGVFGTVNFQHIEIKGTSITTVEQEAFGKSHGTLKSLKLTSNKISSFIFEAIGEFSELLILSLHGNNFNEDVIPNIESQSLTSLDLSTNPKLVFDNAALVQGCPALRICLLGNGGLEHIPIFQESPIGMFTGLKDIETIRFNANSITEIQTNTIIAKSNTLKTVDLAHNSISVLHPSFVKGFITGDIEVQLLLNNNQISLLDEAVWRGITTNILTKQSIQLDGNPLLCGCEMEWLVLEPHLLDTITDTTTCMDGTTSIKSLDADYFVKLCH